jgi:predicted Zn-dependent peptidase
MQSIGRSMLTLNACAPPRDLAKIEAVTLEDVLRWGGDELSAEPSAAVVGKNAKRYIDWIGGGERG